MKFKKYIPPVEKFRFLLGVALLERYENPKVSYTISTKKNTSKILYM